jgi:hypothetical protein
MDIGIKVDTKEINDIAVKSIVRILREVKLGNFNSAVAIKALDILGKSANQPINISNVSIIGDTIVSKMEQDR